MERAAYRLALQVEALQGEGIAFSAGLAQALMAWGVVGTLRQDNEPLAQDPPSAF